MRTHEESGIGAKGAATIYIMNSEQGQTGDVSHHRVRFAHWPKYNVQARFLPKQSALL